MDRQERTTSWSVEHRKDGIMKTLPTTTSRTTTTSSGNPGFALRIDRNERKRRPIPSVWRGVSLLCALLIALLIPLASAQPAGNVVTWTFQGEVAGVPTQAAVSFEQLPRIGVTPSTAATAGIWVETVGQYLLLAGEVVNPYARYMFQAELSNGVWGYGDMVDLTSGERFRIRLDLTPEGFVLSTNPFEGGCGEFGCAHYPFVRTPTP